MKEETLLRYLVGKATAEDLDTISKWISEEDNNAQKLFEIETLWRMKDEQKHSRTETLDKAFDKFIQRNIKIETNTQTSRRFSVPTWVKYAAAVAITSFISISIYHVSINRSTLSYNSMEVPRGQRAKLTLSDGSTVWLNSDSKLTYPDHFGNKSRTVELNGEAYFEVTKDQKHPFIVNSKELDITVLGTKFNMQAYDEDKTATIALKEGSVQVESKDRSQKTIMAPNQQITFSENKIHFSPETNSNIATTWLKGELYFNEETLSAIVTSLERRFDVDIIIVNSNLTNMKFTCRVQQDTALEDILELLKTTRRINYRMDKSNIIIF